MAQHQGGKHVYPQGMGPTPLSNLSDNELLRILGGFLPRDKVIITGLRNSPHLNGSRATVIGFAPGARIAVSVAAEDHGDARRKLSVDTKNLRHNRHSNKPPSTPPPPHADPHSRHPPSGTPTPPDRPTDPKPGTGSGVPSRSLFLATHPQTETRSPEPDVPLEPNGRPTWMFTGLDFSRAVDNQPHAYRSVDRITDPHSRHPSAGTSTPPERPASPTPGTSSNDPSRSLFLATNPQTETRSPELDVPLEPNGCSTSIELSLAPHNQHFPDLPHAHLPPHVTPHHRHPSGVGASLHPIDHQTDSLSGTEPPSCSAVPTEAASGPRISGRTPTLEAGVTPTPTDRPADPTPGTSSGDPSRSLFLATHPQTEKRLPEPDVPLGPNGRSTSIGPPLTSHTPKSTGGLPDDNPSTAKHKRRTRRAGRRRRKGRNSPPEPPHGS